jgi:hypothetical protein
VIEELRILLVRCYGGGGGGRSPLQGTRRISFFVMAKPKKPTGNSQPSNRTQEDERLSKQVWATFRKLLPEYREVITKLAACKGTPLRTFYEDMLNRSMLKMSEHRIGTPRKLADGTEYIQVGYANIAELLLSRLEDKDRWVKFQNTLLKQRLEEYWLREFFDNVVGSNGLDWMLKASEFRLPVMPRLFDPDRKGPKEDRDLIQRLMGELKKYSKFRNRKPKKENLRLYREIEEEHKKLMRLGAHSGWRTAVNIVARKRKRESAPLYKRFMKYKNRLYAK